MSVGIKPDALATVIEPPLRVGIQALLDGQISGREHLPDSPPYIVAANHLSLIDPVLVSAAVGRLVRFLALDDLFGQSAVLDRLMLYFEAIPISRVRAPLGAIKAALGVLAEDHVLGIFPEGARARYWGERSIKRGAAWLAIATGAPVVPVSVIGTEATMSLDQPGIRVPSVKLTIHPPLEPDSYLEYEDPVRSMMDKWVEAIDDEIGHWSHEE